MILVGTVVFLLGAVLWIDAICEPKEKMLDSMARAIAGTLLFAIGIWFVKTNFLEV